MGLLWDIVDAVIDWRIERRRRLPVVAASELSRQCRARDANGRRCVLDQGHVLQHRTGVYP